MKMFRLSIFSFKTVSITSTWSKQFLRIVRFVLLILLLSEIAAMIIVRKDGVRWRYWSSEAFASFEHYKQLESNGELQRVVICGDSTGFCNFDANALDRELGSRGIVWNLSSPGNFAMSFEKSTLPLLKEKIAGDCTIVVSFITAGFVPKDPTPGESGILSSDICKGATFYSRAMSYFCILRVRKCLKSLFSNSFSEEQSIIEARGSGLKKGSLNNRPESSDLTPVRDVLSLTPKPSGFDKKRIEVSDDLLSLCRDRDWSVVIVIPPTLEVGIRKDKVREFRSFLDRLSFSYDFVTMDNFESEELTESDFVDGNHLNHYGADKLTSSLAKVIVDSGVVAR